MQRHTNTYFIQRNLQLQVMNLRTPNQFRVLPVTCRLAENQFSRLPYSSKLFVDNNIHDVQNGVSLRNLKWRSGELSWVWRSTRKLRPCPSCATKSKFQHEGIQLFDVALPDTLPVSSSRSYVSLYVYVRS